MSDEEAAILQRVKDEPGDDTHRLVYADWLEERGGDPPRAEFIRLSVRLDRHPPAACHVDPGCRCDECRDRLRQWELFTDHGVCRGMGLLGRFPTVQLAGWPKESNGEAWVVVRRGFVDAVDVEAGRWIGQGWGDFLTARNPVRRVSLLTNLFHRNIPAGVLLGAMSPPDAGSRHVYQLPGDRRFITSAEVHREVLSERRKYHHLFGLEQAVGGLDRELTRALLRARWPGVEFRMPDDPPWAEFDHLRAWAAREAEAMRSLCDRPSQNVERRG